MSSPSIAQSIEHHINLIAIDIAPISCFTDKLLCPAGDRPN